MEAEPVERLGPITFDNPRLVSADCEASERGRATDREPGKCSGVELATLRRISDALDYPIDLERVLGTIIEELRQLLGITAGSVWLVDPASDSLVCRHATGPKNELLPGWRLPQGEGLCGWAARNGKSLIVSDSRAEVRHFKEVDRRTDLESRSILIIPLRIKHQVIGVLELVDTMPKRFSSDDLAMVEPLAAVGATAIELAQLYDENRRLSQFLNLVIQSANMWVVVVDTESNVLIWNRSAEEISGYSRLEVIGHNHVWEWLHPDDACQAPLFDPAACASRKGDSMEGMETRIQTKSGTDRIIWWHCVPLVNERNAAIGSVAMGHDITERVRAEEALNRKARQQEQLLESARHLTASLNVEDVLGRIASEAMDILKAHSCAVYLLAPDGRTLTPVVSLEPPYEARVLSTSLDVDNSFTGQAVQARRGLIFNDAGSNPAGYQIPGTPVQDDERVVVVPFIVEDKVLGAMCLSRVGITFSNGDLSLAETFAAYASSTLKNAQTHHDLQREVEERRRAEEALRASEEKLRAMFDAIGDGILVLDLAGNVVQGNQVALHMGGFSRQEAMIGRNVSELIAQADREAARAAMLKTLERGGVGPFECRLMRADGEEYLGELTPTVLLDKDHKPIGIIVLVKDISQRKKIEQELQRVQKLESVGTLAGGIAHDFNNILTAVLGNVALARRYAQPGSDMQQILSQAENASLRARELTQQLLTFSKGGAPVKRVASIPDLLTDTATFALRGSNVRCQFSIVPDLWSVEVDEGQLSQVIHNLVLNAEQAMPDGGTVALRAENITLPPEHTMPLPEGRYVRISIQDEGIGISDAHLVKIFDPFFTTKRKGNGLGLAICHSIIKAHSGHITVESKLDVGSTFHVYLPASAEIAHRAETGSGSQPVGAGTVLLMDDDEMVRKTAAQMLGHLGYQVQHATDGAEAIALYRNALSHGERFDAVILDLTVPGGMGGKKAIERLREIDSDVKAIVSSGYSTDPIMAEYASHGFQGVLVKPYRIADLNAAMRNVLYSDIVT